MCSNTPKNLWKESQQNSNAHSNRSTDRSFLISLTNVCCIVDEAKYQDFVFTMSPQTAYVDENDPAVLGCATSGLQDITLHWTLRNQGVNRIIASNSGVVSDLASVIALIKPANLHIKKMINDRLQFGCMVQVPPKFLSAEAEVILISETVHIALCMNSVSICNVVIHRNTIY